MIKVGDKLRVLESEVHGTDEEVCAILTVTYRIIGAAFATNKTKNDQEWYFTDSVVDGIRLELINE